MKRRRNTRGVMVNGRRLPIREWCKRLWSRMHTAQKRAAKFAKLK